jgi:growth hormone-inducible transmembrane protein
MVGSMIGTFNTDPANSFQKHAFWGAFQLSQALFLAPMYFFAPAILARAGLYTVGTVGALSYVSATAKTDQYLYIGGPLLAGLCVVVLGSLAPMVLPVTAVRSLAVSEMVSVYGGLAVFGGFVLYDTQKVMASAKMGRKDACAQSIGLELDAINIFVRLVGIMGGQRRK